ncbi:hypothetical protein T492DRAFT_966908 [Pavlovales sp. CCMP2436]|nr:hypothetical protein T492DRAFT_966908 [Pavlovales sp. CCMP2436]
MADLFGLTSNGRHSETCVRFVCELLHSSLVGQVDLTPAAANSLDVSSRSGGGSTRRPRRSTVRAAEQAALISAEKRKAIYNYVLLLLLCDLAAVLRALCSAHFSARVWLTRQVTGPAVPAVFPAVTTVSAVGLQAFVPELPLGPPPPGPLCADDLIAQCALSRSAKKAVLLKAHAVAVGGDGATWGGVKRTIVKKTSDPSLTPTLASGEGEGASRTLSLDFLIELLLLEKRGEMTAAASRAALLFHAHDSNADGALSLGEFAALVRDIAEGSPGDRSPGIPGQSPGGGKSPGGSPGAFRVADGAVASLYAAALDESERRRRADWADGTGVVGQGRDSAAERGKGGAQEVEGGRPLHSLGLDAFIDTALEAGIVPLAVE